MANTPIIKIPVDAAEFDKFMAAFKDYEARLADIPEEWKKLDAAINSAGGDLAKSAFSTQSALALAATSTVAIVEAIKDASKAQAGFTKQTNSAGSAMAFLSKQVKGVVSGVFDLGRTVLKLGEMGGLGGALAGIAGGLGIADLSGSAMSQQRQAAGLGLSTGQLQAWRSSMGEFVGENVLSGAAGAQVDASKWGYLSALGINPAQATREPATQLAIQEINAARRAFRANPTNQTAQYQAAIALGFTDADIRNAANAPGSALGQDERSAMNTSGLGYSQEVAHQWSMLSNQMTRAGQTIQSALINGLESGHIPELMTKLSAGVSTAISAFLQSPTLKKDLTEFTNWLESPKFMKDLNTFASVMETLANKGESLLKSLGLLPTTQASGGSSSASGGSNRPSDFQVPKNIDKIITPPSARWSFGNGGMDFSALEKKFKLPAGSLMALAKDESGLRPDVTSPKGAQGLFQIMPFVSKALGINPFDPGQSAYTAAYLLGSAYNKYHDLKKAIAAYNWGEKNLDLDIKNHGNEWLKYAPKETQKEISNVTSMIPALPSSVTSVLNKISRQKQYPIVPVRVSVNNSTASRVAISINAAV
jgi:hypothetical protein